MVDYIPFSPNTKTIQGAYRHLTGYQAGATYGRFPYLQPTRGFYDYGPIMTRVEEWPFEEDENGIPYDQGSIWAVSTRLIINLDPDTFEERGNSIWMTAVPRQLPDGYEFKGRCYHVDPIMQDFLGEYPFNGVWTGDPYSGHTVPVYWRGLTGIEPTDGYTWTPMNHNQLGGSVLVGGGTVPTGTDTYGVSLPIPDHIGLRGLKTTLFGLSGYSYSLIVSALPIGSPQPVPGAGDTPTGVVFTGSGHAGSNASLEINESGIMAPTTPGTRMDYYIWIKKSGASSSTATGGTVYWGPRVDVPLWYTASTQDRLAPGGIVVP